LSWANVPGNTERDWKQVIIAMGKKVGKGRRTKESLSKSYKVYNN